MVMVVQDKPLTPGHLFKSKLGANSVLSMLQAVLSAVSVFVAYQIMVRAIGLEKLGLWSLLIAGTSAARLFDVSGSCGLSRFVAERHGLNDRSGMVAYIHTTLFVAIAFNLLTAAAIFFISAPLIAAFIEPKNSIEVTNLLPLALLSSIILPAISGTICSGIDGLQRAGLRAYCNLAATCIFLALSIEFIPKYGVYGYGLCLIAQQIVLSLLAWVTLIKLVPEVGWFPKQLSKDVLKRTVSYGFKIQINSVASLLSEPLAKSILTMWGGLTVLGYYELASKLVFQVKGLLVAGIQPLMPAFAGMALQAEKRNIMLVHSIKISLFGSILLFIGLLLISPIYSHILLNKIDYNMLAIIVALAFGASINIISVPIYFAAMAEGFMCWNLMSQVVVASCILFSTLFAGLLGWGSIIGGIVGGLFLGSIVCYIGNVKALGIASVLQQLNVLILTVIAVLSLFSGLIYALLQRF
jgi:O-antigen/teichoic acid export membrane protein